MVATVNVLLGLAVGSKKKARGREPRGRGCSAASGRVVPSGIQHLIGPVLCLLLVSAAFRPYTSLAQIPSSIYEQVGRNFEQGKFNEAERLLRPALESDPADSRALGLMGVILDAQKRYAEAEGFYQRAFGLDPHSAPLLNNIGNHYLAVGNLERAREAYLKVVAIDPARANANLHLAQLSVAAKQGEAALRYLDRLPAAEQSVAALRLLRAQALYLAGRQAQAVGLIQSTEEQGGSDPHVSFAAGMLLAGWQRYEEAERAFTQALEAAPADFDILYNLGLAATRAGDYDRAREIFQTALKQRPNDVDCLYNLARVFSDRGQYDQAVALLVRAQQDSPARPDVLLFLARASERLGYFADTASAYDQYLKLKPEDDTARRERGFALARSAQLEQGIVDLRWYVRQHPENARGLYELGIAETVRERAKALEHLNQAIALDSKLNAARYARAVLLYQKGKASQAIPDLTYIVNSDPKDYRALDQLGEAYMAVGRTREAVEVLGRAAKAAPNDTKILAHYGHALLRTGRNQEGQQVLARFQQLEADPSRRQPYGGLFEFLKLPAAEQEARYLENLQRKVKASPRDPLLQARLGRALLARGRTQEGLAAFREVHALTADPGVLTESARALMEYQQFGPARELLETALRDTSSAASGPAANARLELAIATFHSAGADAGLAVLDTMPAGQRQGNYFLLRAQMLDAAGRVSEAIEDLNRGFSAVPTRPDLYFQAALFLIKHEQYRRAVAMLRQATHVLPDAPDLLLTEAIAYELLQQPDDAQKILTSIESRWPEWGEPYLINGIMLETRLKSAQAKPLLQTAISLGQRESTAYYYLALATTHADPDDVKSAEEAIDQALRLDPRDPYIRALAGRIAYLRKDYSASVEQLTAALQVWPEMVEARQTLSAAYRALGNRDRAAAELKEILRIKQATGGAEQAPPSPVRNLLFSVRLPAEARAGESP